MDASHYTQHKWQPVKIWQHVTVATCIHIDITNGNLFNNTPACSENTSPAIAPVTNAPHGCIALHPAHMATCNYMATCKHMAI